MKIDTMTSSFVVVSVVSVFAVLAMSIVFSGIKVDHLEFTVYAHSHPNFESSIYYNAKTCVAYAKQLQTSGVEDAMCVVDVKTSRIFPLKKED